MIRTVLSWIVHIPDLFLSVFCINRDIELSKEYVQKPFVCPNCGTTFFAKWYQLWLGRDVTLVMVNKAKLKCPKCNQKDFCKWTGKDDA